MQLLSCRTLLRLLLTRVCVCLCFPGANLTSSLDRIKIVFTPMLCRRVCSGGRCHNSCEKGDTTTVYSENHQRQQQQRQQQSEKQGFRLCELSTVTSELCLVCVCLFAVFLFLISQKEHTCTLVFGPGQG